MSGMAVDISIVQYTVALWYIGGFRGRWHVVACSDIVYLE